MAHRESSGPGDRSPGPNPDSGPDSGLELRRDPGVGLCSICALASQLDGAKRVTYWRCGRADADARFRRYPTLPVAVCTGYERGAPTRGLLRAD